VSASVIDLDPLATEALLVTRVVDAASGQPRPVLSATTDIPHAHARVATGSFLVLSGRSELVLPKLATQPYQLDSELAFPDRAPLALAFTVPAGTTLPFRPAQVPVELAPVSLQGTITQAAFPGGPIPHAAITIAASAPAPALLALRTPIAVEHPLAATVTACTAAATAPATTLAHAAAQGAEQVTPASLAGIAAGDALILGSDVDLEHALVAALDPIGTVTLTAPLRRSRPAGTPVQAGAITPAGATGALVRAGTAGDGVLELSGAVAADLVQIDGTVREVRATGAITDAAGHWQLDGVRAIGQLAVTVGAAGFLTAGPVVYDVDYHQPNLIDLRLTV
jgi:hypothetical protein